MQMTTREAVKDALVCMTRYIDSDEATTEGVIYTQNAMRLLCEYYGFNLNDFLYAEVF